MTLSQTTIDTVKATVPVLKEKINHVVLAFYDLLFVRYPELKQYFNMDRHRGGISTENGMPAQVVSLARAVLTYAKNIDNVQKIMPVVEGICHKHVARGVSAAQYAAVGECLVAGMGNVLGDDATPAVISAWNEAYEHLAGAFIDTEKRLRAELAARAGFDGVADMTVEKVTPTESDGMEIVFARANGEPVGTYGNGQFVAVRVAIGDGQENMTTAKLVPGESGKITLCTGTLQEKASIALRNLRVGETIPVSMPCGKVRPQN